MSAEAYEVGQRSNKRGVDLISNALPYRREPNAIGNAVDSAKFQSLAHAAIIRVFDESGAVIETRKHAGEFKEP